MVLHAASDALGGLTTRELIFHLLSSLSPDAERQHEDANPLRDLPGPAKNVLLTLYALFEEELLPALDLLDRRLVTRLRLQTPVNEAAGENRSDGAAPVYLVRSAQQHSGRNSSYEHLNCYEVRLQAWSCSCPAFIFSAFPPSAADPSARFESTTMEPCPIGGLTRGLDVPMCKHLLACVLVQYCALFAHCADEREVSIEELAGWSAGWGD